MTITIMRITIINKTKGNDNNKPRRASKYTRIITTGRQQYTQRNNENASTHKRAEVITTTSRGKTDKYTNTITSRREHNSKSKQLRAYQQ